MRTFWREFVSPAAFTQRLFKSAVAWSLGFNFLRLASGLLLLPLLLRLLPKADLGMYYVFLSLNAIAVVLDLGFSPTIGRFVNYAMGGAQKLTPQGLSSEIPHGTPNFKLLWELLLTMRIFYAYVAIGAVVILSSFGTFMVWQKAAETSSVGLTWWAWAISIAAVATDAYCGLWNIFLRNLNQVVAAARIAVFGYALRLTLACALLLRGGNLLSLPAASLVTSLLIGYCSRRACLRVLAAYPAPDRVDWRAYFRIIWPNSWRLGLYLGGVYLSTNANVLLCSSVFGLEANAKYGLSLQVINIISGMAAVWTAVKWPLIGQLVAQQNIEKLREVFWPRIWLQVVTFIGLGAGAIILGPILLRFIRSDKELLPVAWMSLLAANGLLENHCYTWNTFISLWNRLPMLWPSLATNAVALGLNLIFIHLPNAQPGFLVLGPLLASAALNYWFWPNHGARSLRLSWFQFLRYGFERKQAILGRLTKA